MDLNLAQVRAFLAIADRGHFGHAAASLSVTQQALSKRIAALEDALGARLFDRGLHGVALTDAGHRFLEPARRALAASDAAVAAVRDDVRPIRIDLWGHLYAPGRTVSQAVERMPDLAVELGATRDLPTVVGGLVRGEIDTGFGRVHRTGLPGEETLTHRLVRLEPVDAVLAATHPLAGAAQLRPAELRDSVLWCPAAVDRLDFLRRFADQFGVATESGVNLGIERFVDHIAAEPTRFSLFPADAPLPADPRIRSVPLVAPTPLYAWSLIWPDRTRHPRIDALLRGFLAVGRASRWLEYHPDRDWLPRHDRDELTTVEKVTR